MGFFAIEERVGKKNPARVVSATSVAMLHRTECKSCPLNHAKCRSPKIAPLGDEEASIYMLGTAPNEAADDTDRPMAGEEFRIIKRAMPREAFARARFNNIIRTHPGMKAKPEQCWDKEQELYDVREPTFVEIECCRPSIVRDIEETRPTAIFTFGGPALRWVAGETHANLWQGRRIPVRVGNHECWLYPFQSPIDFMRERRWDGYVGDNEKAFSFYLKRACREVLGEDVASPVIHSKERALANIECIDGANGSRDLRRVEDFLFGTAVKEEFNGYDIETNALRPYNQTAKLLSFSVSASEKHTISVGVEHPGALWSKTQRQDLMDMLKEYLKHEGPAKAVHQLAFEMEWMAVFFGASVLRAGYWEDTISQAYIINETQGLLSLDSLTMQYFGFNIKSLSGVNRKNLENTPLGEVLPYNGLDAKYHLALCIEQMDVLRERHQMKQYEHQLARIPALVLSQIEGVPINQTEVREYRREFDAEIAEANKVLASLPKVRNFRDKKGEPYSPTNPQHLAQLLTQSGHKLAKTEKGGDATDVKNLSKLMDKEPVIAATIKHRKASKVLGTYIDAVTPGAPTLFEDGRVHPIISTTTVDTWRTSSEDPNIQNWPKRNENAKIRKVVGGKAGWKVVSFDYAGIQARNVGMESRDKRLIKYFLEDYDVHSDWLEKMNKICPEWVPLNAHKDKGIWKAARNGIKNQFVFPTFFGARPSEKMCLGIAAFGRVVPKPKQMAEMQEWFFDEFPDIYGWHQRLHRDYDRLGYVTGCSGHRRHAPVAHNQIINAPIQADEAIIVLSSHIALSERNHRLYQPMMEIHDDLTFFWPTKEIDERAEVVIEEMTKVRYDWINPIPLEIEMSVGDDWASQKEVGKFKSTPDGGWVEIKK